jgi:hypothetical protein
LVVNWIFCIEKQKRRGRPFLEICSLFGQVTRQEAIYEHKSDRPLDKEKGISPVAVFRVLVTLVLGICGL